MIERILTNNFRLGAAGAALAFCLLPAFLAGCAEETPLVVTGQESAPTATAPPYQRQTFDFYKGIAEPRADAWQEMSRETDRLKKDGFNSVTLAPPVLITQRAGGQPRVILEGEAASAEGLIEDFHRKGFAVHLAPTTKIAGFGTQVEPTDATLEHLAEDAVRWAKTAEEKQAELFSPLSQYNLVLGTEAAGKWSRKVLPQVREKYHGPVAAKVVADLAGAPAPGQPHDFELLDFRGYDFLMVDIFPRGESYDAAGFDAYVTDVLERARQVAQRDGLKGVMVGEFGSWREPSGVDPVDGPILGDAAQADMAARFLQIAMPRTSGVFYYGWTLPGRGARDYPVEDTIAQIFAG